MSAKKATNQAARQELTEIRDRITALEERRTILEGLLGQERSDNGQPVRRRRSTPRVPLSERIAPAIEYLRQNPKSIQVNKMAIELDWPSSTAYRVAEALVESGKAKAVKTTKTGLPRVIEYRPTRVHAGDTTPVQG